MGRKTQHRFHGGPERFEVLAAFIADYFGQSIEYIADVAGGQGMLSLVLNKRYNYRSEVIDPLARPHGRSAGRRYDQVHGWPLRLSWSAASGRSDRPVAASAAGASRHHRAVLQFWLRRSWAAMSWSRPSQTVLRRTRRPLRTGDVSLQGPKNIGLVSQPPASKSG
ncbi:MAG: hypothetical protein R2851_17115 [Caldilineaceae bacterium]